jgi:hypothetical protein
VPKPPHRNKKGIGQRKKKSIFDYGHAQDTLGLPGRAHHFQVYSAAVASADNIAADKTLLVISLTKEEVKAEWDMLHTIATEFERKIKSSKNEN